MSSCDLENGKKKGKHTQHSNMGNFPFFPTTLCDGKHETDPQITMQQFTEQEQKLSYVIYEATFEDT